MDNGLTKLLTRSICFQIPWYMYIPGTRTHDSILKEFGKIIISVFNYFHLYPNFSMVISTEHAIPQIKDRIPYLFRDALPYSNYDCTGLGLRIPTP